MTFDNNCSTCQDMANSEYGIEEPHQAHAPVLPDECFRTGIAYAECPCQFCEASAPPCHHSSDEWTHTPCPSCGKPAVEETHTKTELIREEVLAFLVKRESELRRNFLDSERRDDMLAFHFVSNLMDTVLDAKE